jgi:hypothetical protein
VDSGTLSLSAAAARVAPRRKPRLWLALGYAVEVGCALCGGRRFYRARHLAPGRFELRHERVEVPHLPRALEGLRIAQLSDLHAGRFLGPGDLRAVVEAVNELEVDLVVLTGDYISHHWSDALRLAPDLARLRPRLGAFAVFGNHDYRDRAEGRIAECFAGVGVRVLRNECVRLECGGAHLALVGVEDLEEAKRLDPAAARAELRAGDVEVLLCHNPLGAERLARPGCALILSGHTHGVQIDLPFLRRIGPPHPGDRRRVGATTAITSRGLGVVGLPLRLGSRAEVVVIDLHGAGGARG